MQNNRTEVISFTKNIPANTKNLILSERVKDNGIVQGLNVRFYSGQQLALRVRPFVEVKGTKSITDLITYPENTDPYLSGDDDQRRFPCAVSVNYDDEIKVLVSNTSPDYDYTLVVDVTIAYFGGGE